MKKYCFRAALSILLIFTTVISLIGCSYDEHYQKNLTGNTMYGNARVSNMLKGLENPHTEQSTHSMANDNGLRAFSASDSSPATTMHTNELLYYWPDVSNAIKQLDGIATAHVFVTNKNAYVGIMFSDNEHAQTIHKKGYDQYHRHEVAPRSIAAAPYDHFYSVNNNELVTNELYHEVALMVSNYAAPRQVFVTDNHDFLHHLADYSKIAKKNISLQPWLHEFNVLVQYYFADGLTEPIKINDKK